jgi:hypothetical protein
MLQDPAPVVVVRWVGVVGAHWMDGIRTSDVVAVIVVLVHLAPFFLHCFDHVFRSYFPR